MDLNAKHAAVHQRCRTGAAAGLQTFLIKDLRDVVLGRARGPAKTSRSVSNHGPPRNGFVREFCGWFPGIRVVLTRRPEHKRAAQSDEQQAVFLPTLESGFPLLDGDSGPSSLALGWLRKGDNLGVAILPKMHQTNHHVILALSQSGGLSIGPCLALCRRNP